MKTITEK